MPPVSNSSTRRLPGKAALLWTIFLCARAGGEEPRDPTDASPPRPSLALATTATTSPARSAVSADEAHLAGSYVYIGGASERAVVKAAVDRATEGMFGKVIAREELMKRSEPRPSYTIRFEEDGKLSVETPGFPSECTPVDGTEVVVRNKFGDVVKESQEFVDGVLVQSGRNDDGSGSTEFRLGSDGNTLLVVRVSRSPRLPRPVAYSLTYYRQPPPR